MSLTFSESTEGYLVPTEDQHVLASKTPWEEAKSWCQDILVKDPECIIVGLGAGFHVAELIRQKKLEKVYVVDTRPGLLNIFRKQFPELADVVEVIIVENADALLKHEIMEEVMEKNVSAFAFNPSWPKNNLAFADFHRHLTGRSRPALDLFLKRHGLKRDIQFIDEMGQRYLTIKDIELLIQEDVPPFLRLNCFRILKELIL